MRIGLCGSHGVGKTEVAKRYSQWTGARLVTSASREVAGIGYPINDVATCESQAATSMGRLAKQVAAGDNFVSDRTLLDSMAYNLYQLEHVWDASDPKVQYWYNTMDIITGHYMREYDLIVYVPITFPIVVDGVRLGDVDYQWVIDNNVRSFIERYGLSVETMPSGSVAERTDWLTAMARRKRAKH